MINKNFRDWIDDVIEKFNRISSGGVILGALVGVLLWILFDSALWITLGIIIGFIYDKYNE